MDALERALRFLWAQADRCADEVEPVPSGTVLRTRSIPKRWTWNGLRLEGAHPGLTLTDADALCAARVPDATFRHVMVEHHDTAERLAAAARADGWTVETERLMLLRRGADRTVDAPPVRAAAGDEALELLDLWFHEDFAAQGEEALIDLRRSAERERERSPWQAFVAEHDGRAAAMCSVLADGGVAQVEDVYVHPAARGQGLGRAVTAAVTERARAAGHDVVFIVADAAGWPQRLYGRLGYDPAGDRAALHRDVGG